MNTAYQRWLHSLSYDLLKEDYALSLPDEMELQSLWYQGAFGLEFETTEGQSVKIAYLGEWNHGAGPDFQECLITIDGEEKKGAIELDLSPAYWELHNHAVNPAFNEVILHVSFAPTHAVSYCRTAENKAIPQVHVPQEAIREALEIKPNAQVDMIPGFCAEEFHSWSREEVLLLIKEASKHRLQQKATKLGRQIAAVGIKETMWQALATTLGYRPNQFGLRLLSQRIKAKDLAQYKDVQTRQAILLGTSQFLAPELYTMAPEPTQNYLESLWQEWWKYRKNYELNSERHLSWQMHGQRPVNHPHRRVASLAILFKYLPQIVKAVEAPTSERILELKTALCDTRDAFWSHHYTLRSERAQVELSLFGEDKFKELLNNFILPIWYLKDQDSAFSFYSKKRSRAQNTEVRKALGRLFPQHPSKADFAKFCFQQQGLQQLYRDFCLKSGCLQCPFPKLSSATSNTFLPHD